MASALVLSGLARCRIAESNMQSAGERPSTTDTFLANEIASERVLGSINPSLESSLQVNCFGLRTLQTSGS